MKSKTQYLLDKNGMLSCQKCGIAKTLDEFRLRGRSKRHCLGRKHTCRDCKYIQIQAWRKDNKEIVQAATKQWKQDIKGRCLDHYGHECAWCGDNDFGTLTLDHINNDGYLERKKLGMCWLWNHVLKSGFPDHYQVLCMGCNTYKAWHGELPNSKKKLDIQTYSLANYASRSQACQ